MMYSGYKGAGRQGNSQPVAAEASTRLRNRKREKWAKK
jgi:hypothetical protein